MGQALAAANKPPDCSAGGFDMLWSALPDTSSGQFEIRFVCTVKIAWM